MTRVRRACLIAPGLAIAVLAATSAPAGAVGQVEARHLATAPTETLSWVARIVERTNAHTAPDSSSALAGNVNDMAPWNHGPMRLLVLDAANSADGARWLKVLLARKPNDSTGWIPADYAQLRATGWRVQVDISSRRIKVFRGGVVKLRARVVVGARGTPTPTGRFSVREVVKQPDAHGFGGPWILHLNANSQKLKSFDGGDGTIGIHGRGGASLKDPLGSARSHGCVRVDNRVVRFLARHFSGGEPVEIER